MNSLTPFIVLSFLLALAGCDEKKPTEEGKTTSARAPSPPSGLAQLDPPRPRLALPPTLRVLRLKNDDVGTITDTTTPERTLNGFGLASCQNGWTFQGHYLGDDGQLVSTVPFNVELATVPTGRRVIYEDPDIPGRALALDFSSFGYELVRGTVEVLDTTTDQTLLQMTVDGPPTTLTRAPGLGPAGCFDTGFWKASAGDVERFGPVTAVYDPANLHYVGLRLSPTENLVVIFTLRPNERGRGDLIRTTAQKIQENPDLIPIRIYMEERVDRERPTGDTTGPQITMREVPIEEAKLLASFPTGEVGGPMRIELQEVELPEWDGPLAGVKIDQIRVETLFVTDDEGAEVPLPNQPEWYEKEPVIGP